MVMERERERENRSRWWFLTCFFNVHPENQGDGIQFDEHIFQRGWFNHQLDLFLFSLPSLKLTASLHLKMDDWKTILSFLRPASFEGLKLLVSGSVGFCGSID